MPELEPLRADHADAVLAFELANRAYFARSITDRGDTFFERFAENHRAMLAEQRSGVCALHVLVDDDGAVLGRFNLYDIVDGTAVVGYRVAERATGRGLATEALRALCEIARARHRVRTLTAAVSETNVASRRVLEKAGFAAAGAVSVAGRPGTRYARSMPSPEGA